MNRGEIPGFYYDEQKKKYFEIQANHLVPPTAKYSENNIKQQQRKVKKRKVELREQRKRLQQTVKRHPVLHDPFLGIGGLQREHGNLRRLDPLEAHDETLVANWRQVELLMQNYESDAEDSDQNLFITAVHCIAVRDLMLYSLADRTTRTSQLCAAFPDDGHRNVWKRFIACAFNHASGPKPSADMCIGTEAPGDACAKLMINTDHPLTAQFNQWTLEAAVLIPRGITIYDDVHIRTESMSVSGMMGLPKSQHGRVVDAQPFFGPSVDWLDYNTVAFNYNDSINHRHCVGLWDTRERAAVSARFNMSQRTTGVMCLWNTESSLNENHLLIPTNHTINLFDKRMPHSVSKSEQPILQLKHVHGGPELKFVSNGKSTIAAVDRDNIVQLYSMRTGKHLGTTEPSQGSNGGTRTRSVNSLQWIDNGYDDGYGRCLQVCDESGPVRWCWQNELEEEAEEGQS